jgi:hypothetical protein
VDIGELECLLALDYAVKGCVVGCIEKLLFELWVRLRIEERGDEVATQTARCRVVEDEVGRGKGPIYHAATTSCSSDVERVVLGVCST